MKPKAIYLIRHGESEGNINGEIYKTVPDWQIPLTENGRKQAEEARQFLIKDIGEIKFSWSTPREPVFFYSSPMYRAKQTAEILNGIWGAEIFFDPRLREQEWGNYAESFSEKGVEHERKMYSVFYYRMPNGESGANVYDRITTVIDTMHRDFAKEDFPMNAVIISHGYAIKAFLMRWFHWSSEDFDSYMTPKNCEILKMVLKEGLDKYELVTPLRRRTEEDLYV
jgi:broad specificity phosphatase PhoE